MLITIYSRLLSTLKDGLKDLSLDDSIFNLNFFQGNYPYITIGDGQFKLKKSQLSNKAGSKKVWISLELELNRAESVHLFIGRRSVPTFLSLKGLRPTHRSGRFHQLRSIPRSSISTCSTIPRSSGL